MTLSKNPKCISPVPWSYCHLKVPNPPSFCCSSSNWLVWDCLLERHTQSRLVFQGRCSGCERVSKMTQELKVKSRYNNKNGIRSFADASWCYHYKISILLTVDIDLYKHTDRLSNLIISFAKISTFIFSYCLGNQERPVGKYSARKGKVKQRNI